MNENANSTERLRAAFQGLSRGATPRQDCPDPDRIWLAAHGEAPSEELGRIVDHIAKCPSCAEAWRLAMPEAGEPALATAPPRSGNTSAWIVLAGGLAAAALALVAFVAPMEPATRPDLAPTMRTADTPEIVSLLDESVPLPADDFVLRWSWDGGAEGVSYDVEITETDLDPVHTAHGLTEPGYRVPGDALASLGSGQKLVWRVEASLPDGRRLSSTAFIAHLE